MLIGREFDRLVLESEPGDRETIRVRYYPPFHDVDYREESVVLVPRLGPCDCRALASFKGHQTYDTGAFLDDIFVPDDLHEWHIVVDETHQLSTFKAIKNGWMEARLELVREVQ